MNTTISQLRKYDIHKKYIKKSKKAFI